MSSQQSAISVRFDKSHLTSIGARLYTQSLDLIRELVSNAYDADATLVKITVDEHDLVVLDDGCGMDRAGLEQYFTIGSPFKRTNTISPKYKRTRIGEFGIGKFAVLALCDRFELYTSNGGYAATVIFDKSAFEAQSEWNVPIIEHAAESTRIMGTRVYLHDLKKPVSLFELERYLTNLFPLTDGHFAIEINGKRLTPTYIPGDRFPIHETTQYGRITGEIILASLILPKDQIGVGVRVKGVLIKRDTFEIESQHKVSMRKLTGEVNANFLPITTSRDAFITDSKEYSLFYALMQKKLRRVVRSLDRRAESYQDKKAEKVLSDVLLMIRNALKKNRDIFMTGDLPLFTKKPIMSADTHTDGHVITTALTKKKIEKNAGMPKAESELDNAFKEAVKRMKPKVRGRIKTLLRDDHRIVKKVKIGGVELLVSFAHLGGEEKESFVEGGIIFINRDHLLFKYIEKKSELSFYHLIRLVSQELISFSSPRNLETAFAWQGKLIKDAFLTMQSKSDNTE